MSPSPTIRLALALTILAVTAACNGNRSPVAPTSALAAGPTPAPAPAPPAGTPDLTGPSRTFGFASPLSYAVSEGTAHSEYVLYDNGSFVLRYRIRGWDYAGTYTLSAGQVLFLFSADPVQWQANGSLTDGRTLEVRYSFGADLSGFEPAIYTDTGAN